MAIDHALYSWPCAGLEDRSRVIAASVAGRADGIIASYGTLKAFRTEFGDTTPILKLDLTTVTVGGEYPVTPYRLAWTVDQAGRLGAGAVLTFVQLGSEEELDSLTAAAKTAVEADDAGLDYVCEIMPVASPRFPDPTTPDAVAAAARTGDELGATVIKTSMPRPVVGVETAISACNVPVILAGGSRNSDEDAFLFDVETAMKSRARGVAVGRNVWGSPNPEAMVSRLRAVLDGISDD